MPDNLDRLPSLKTVYFVQNRITKITALDGVGATLRSLELGGNKIRVRLELRVFMNICSEFSTENRGSGRASKLRRALAGKEQDLEHREPEFAEAPEDPCVAIESAHEGRRARALGKP